MNAQGQSLIGGCVAGMQTEDHVHWPDWSVFENTAFVKFHIPIVKALLNAPGRCNHFFVGINANYPAGNAPFLLKPIIEHKGEIRFAAATV